MATAKRSRASQIAYVAERNPQAALDMANAIRVAIDRLANHSRMGRPGRVLGTYELVVPRTPYIVVYEIDGDIVRIFRVLHNAQRWPPMN
jgi:addiction module RelE/StbE family toxin